jgi:Lrp/AsnC family transcriptional regulator, leucine-responsive regulatory protein
MTVATMSEYEDLTRRLFFENHSVRRFRTLIAIDRVKTGLSVPITLPGPTSGAIQPSPST